MTFKLRDDEQQVLEPEEQTPEVEVEEPEEVQEEAPEEEAEEQEEESEEQEPKAEPEEGLVVSLGEEPEGKDEQRAPQWVRDLRTENRRLQRDLREVRTQLNAQAPAQAPKPLGPKPTLEGSDYDAVKYEAALAEWLLAKKAVDEVEAKQTADLKAREQVWQSKLASYTSSKARLGVKDFQDAEAVVMNNLSVTQQGIIVSGAKDAALLLYALGKNEKQLKLLAAIQDPVEFAFAVARMEAQMKVRGKKPSTEPETKVAGNARSTSTVNSALERLRAEAEKTGDYTKVNAYKAKLRQKQR